MKHLLRCALLLAVVACASGMNCARSRPVPPPKPPATKVEYFKDRFQDIRFPHGQIDLSTVKDTPDGVEYQTEDGSRWKVSMTKEGERYRLGTPERVP
jgi:hypothetical protein